MLQLLLAVYLLGAFATVLCRLIAHPLVVRVTLACSQRQIVSVTCCNRHRACCGAALFIMSADLQAFAAVVEMAMNLGMDVSLFFGVLLALRLGHALSSLRFCCVLLCCVVVSFSISCCCCNCLRALLDWHAFACCCSCFPPAPGRWCCGSTNIPSMHPPCPHCFVPSCQAGQFGSKQQLPQL